MRTVSSHKWQAFTGIALLTFGCYLDYTIVNVALPTIQVELKANLIQLQWVMNIYFLALCIFATIMGRCGDLYGRRFVFYVGISIFTVASLIAGFSTHIYWLISGRLLQGIGASIVFPLGPSLLNDAFPENESKKAIAWLGSLGGIALALGSMLGGLIVTYFGWRWIFFINIPIILVGYLFSYRSIPKTVVTHKVRELDCKGMILIAIFLGSLIIGLIQSQNLGWLNLVTLACFVIALLSGIFLFKIENSTKNPLIDFKDFANPLFYSGAILCFLAGLLSAVALFFDPLYLQIIQKQSPEFSGMVLFSIPLSVFLVAFMVSWLIHQLGIINTIIIGLSFAIAGCFLHTFFTYITPIWYIVIAFVLLGGVWAMGNTVSIIAGQAAVGSERSSVATGTIITMFNIGGSIGLAISVVIYHFFSTYNLSKMLSILHIALTPEQLSQINILITNPAEILNMKLIPTVHSVFNAIFMQSFVMVMWFLVILSVFLLLSILAFKFRKSGDAIRL